MALLKRPQSDVEWVAKADPASPFDIKTVRTIGGAIVPFYLEVKSSASIDEDNIYISERQKRFLQGMPDTSAVAIVKFESGKDEPTVREVGIVELENTFAFEPVKYKLLRK